MKLEGIRRKKNLSWEDTFILEEVHLESGTGSAELETAVHIINSNPAWKRLLDSQRKEGSNSFCDVHLHASNGYLPVHRIFLQNKSEFLDSLIKENLRVSMPQCSDHSTNIISISLMDVKLAHLKTLMVLLYTGVAEIKEEDEHDIRNLIRMLQMENTVKVEKEVHDPSVKRKRKDLKCFSIEEDIHVSGGSSNNPHPPQGAPSGTGRLRTASGASSTPTVSSVQPSDVPSFIPPPETFTKKLRTELLQCNFDSTSVVDEQQQHTLPGYSENAVVNNNQLPRHPDMPPEITEVLAGALLPLEKQPEIVSPPLATGGRGRGRGGGGRTSGMTAMNALKSQVDDEDSNGPNPKLKYEMDDDPSDEPNEEDDDNIYAAIAVSDNCTRKLYPKQRCEDSSSAGPSKEAHASSSGAVALATVPSEDGPSICRDYMESVKRLLAERAQKFTARRCFYCGDIFEEEPDLIAHLKSSCAKRFDDMYDLRKRHCKACHTFFSNYSASDFMDHVSTCCVGERTNRKSTIHTCLEWKTIEDTTPAANAHAHTVPPETLTVEPPANVPPSPPETLTVEPPANVPPSPPETLTVEPPANVPPSPPETLTVEPPANVSPPPQETLTVEPPAPPETLEILRPAIENKGVSHNTSAFEPTNSPTPNECVPIWSRPGPKSAKRKAELALQIKNKPGPKSSKMAKGSNGKGLSFDLRPKTMLTRRQKRMRGDDELEEEEQAPANNSVMDPKNPMLDNDLLTCMFKVCRLRDLRQFRLVSKQWYSQSLPILRKEMTFRIDLLGFNDTHTAEKRRHADIIKKLQIGEHPFEAYCFRGFNMLHKPIQPEIQLLDKFGPTIRKLTLDAGVLCCVRALQQAIFEKTPNLEELHMCEFDFDVSDCDGKCKMPKYAQEPLLKENLRPNLRSLIITSKRTLFPIYWKMMFAHFPNIERIHLFGVTAMMHFWPFVEALEEVDKKTKSSSTKRIKDFKFDARFDNGYCNIAARRLLRLPHMQLEVLSIKCRNSEQDVLPKALQIQGRNLKKLEIQKGSMIISKKNNEIIDLEPIPDFPFQVDAFDSMTELTLEGAIASNLYFLEQFPHLKVLIIRQNREDRILNGTDFSKLKNLVLPNVRKFEFCLLKSTNFHLSNENMKMFVKMMPNVDDFRGDLMPPGLRVVCRNWRRMKKLGIYVLKVINLAGGDITWLTVRMRSIRTLNDLKELTHGVTDDPATAWTGFDELPFLQSLELNLNQKIYL